MTGVESSTVRPYQSTREHLFDELDRIDRLLEFHLADPATDPEGVTAEIDDEALEYSGESTAHNVQQERTGGITADAGTDRTDLVTDMATLASRIADRIDRTMERQFHVGGDSIETGEECESRFAMIAHACDLSRLECDLLLLALLPDLYDGYEGVYAALQNTTPPTLPTVGLLVRLLEPIVDSRDDLLVLLTETSSLRRSQLLEVSPSDHESSHLMQVVTVDPHVRAYLTGYDELDPALDSVAAIDHTDVALDDLALPEPVLERVEATLDSSTNGTNTLYVCYGPDGAGKERTPNALWQSEKPLLRGDLTELVATGLLDRFQREAAFRNAAVHLENASILTDGRRKKPQQRDGESAERTPDRPGPEVDTDSIVETIDGFPNDVYVTSESRWIPDVELTNHEFAMIEFPAPEYDLQRSLWAENADALSADVTPTELAGVFDLTQEEIERAVSTIEALRNAAARIGDEIDRHAVYEGCKSQSAGRLDSLAEHLEPGYTWKDIVLPTATETQLRQVSAHVTERYTVYDEWGFESRFSRGTGVVALFSGPSGTGKTMAAEILANESGLDLYKVDLSSVVSKYIGETEENLERIFEEAERSNAILLFDEADAIFGERSEVSDSTDRYANVEVNYLLQRIERYDGVVLLTTNYESNIDEAFRRRIHLSVDFDLPTDEQRQEIWRGIFPDETPTSDLDYEFLSKFELSGGNIRNVAQSAAFIAAADRPEGDEGENETASGANPGADTVVRRPVEMADVVMAIKREYEKNGRLIDPMQFEPYREDLIG